MGEFKFAYDSEPSVPPEKDWPEETIVIDLRPF